MRPSQPPPALAESPWPHRMAWVVAGMVFPLVALGGLVTTYEAGMSVSDWPTTFGHWFYPIQQWIHSHRDVILEHTHRVWAQATGCVAIATAVVFWLKERRPGARWLGAALFVGACLQGVLGGLRVWWNMQFVAMIHACTAALFFALAVAAVVVTSRCWAASLEHPPLPVRSPRLLQWTALILSVGLYMEIVLGAQLRHHLPSESQVWTAVWVWSKVLLAIALLLTSAALWIAVRKLAPPAGSPAATAATEPATEPRRRLRRQAGLLFGVMSLQVALAAATWVTNYGWPQWFQRWVRPMGYTVVAEGWLQVAVTTLHVAVGSLAMALAIVLAMWLWRLLRPVSPLPAR